MDDAVARTDVGRQRDRNEDSVLATRLEAVDASLLAVADGMGGHQAGDVASETAIRVLHEELSDALSDERSRQEVLEEAVTKANEQVREAAAGDAGEEGMGTTLVAALIADGEALIANVGDSRAYLVGDGVEQVTVDQSLVRKLIEEGTIDEEKADDHPHRHVLAQALGTEESVEPEFFECDLVGRTLLLCSDGLTEEVPDTEIGEIVEAGESLDMVADGLIERANKNGGSDNVSVVLYRAGNESESGIASRLVAGGRRLLSGGGE